MTRSFTLALSLFALSTRAEVAPSPDCAAIARRAALAVFKINHPESRARVGSVSLTGAHSDKEEILVSIDADRGTPASALVVTETLGGVDCRVLSLEMDPR